MSLTKVDRSLILLSRRLVLAAVTGLIFRVIMPVIRLPAVPGTPLVVVVDVGVGVTYQKNFLLACTFKLFIKTQNNL